MNVILIPFFLAADVVVNNTSEWTYGPEYLYDVDMSFVLTPDRHGPVQNVRRINTLSCRPKTPDHLFCHFNNGTEMASVKNQHMSKESEMEEKFEIKFNERGVEGVIVEPNTHEEMVNVIRKIATQFNVAVDRSKIDMSHFTVREDSSMGNCSTMYSVTRGKAETERGGDFRLAILPLTDAKKRGTTLSIEKSRTECINPPQHVGFTKAKLEMVKFLSKIQIEPNKFETSSEFDGKVQYVTSENAGEVSMNERLHINLNSIKPAQNKLPTLSHGELTDLNTNHKTPSNTAN
ncbi:PREDICTED: uncharacterized protein LOC105558020 [Vollenhovia emeryi]|uniref:uncharacterized protein LOC105558020 n=1 Tax=Vollenhovia emeryi TaxID=411798 RepID=UPI0005F493B7|nr:PREDICTED: uncharacterized protein LOC105558020 [Vollenhovia emeryi]